MKMKMMMKVDDNKVRKQLKNYLKKYGGMDTLKEAAELTYTDLP